MDFLELAKNRYSCRSFSTKEIEQEKINKILEAAHVAPTACNIQPQKILVLTDKDQLNKLSEATRFGWNAPLIFIICYNTDLSWKRKYDNQDEGIVDASIITTHMMLEANNLGLGCTWIGAFNPYKVKEIYNIPDNYKVVSILPVGYPSEDAKPTNMHYDRKPLSETVSFNKFN